MSHLPATTRIKQAQLVSLFDMLACHAAPFYKTTGQLFNLQELLREKLKERERSSPLTEDELEHVRRVLDGVDNECEKIQLERALERLALFRIRYQTLNGMLILDNHLTLEDFDRELKEIERCIRMDLYDPNFVVIQKNLKDYCNNEKLFDTDNVTVSKRFPKANVEFTRAGNCFAVEEYTACIFHLMRGLEQGLRALAKAVAVPFPKTYDQKTWGTLISDIQDKINKLPKTNKRFDFYNGAAAQFRFFKNAWRDYVMHTKEKHPYDYYEAARVMDHARDFMRHITPRLKELK